MPVPARSALLRDSQDGRAVEAERLEPGDAREPVAVFPRRSASSKWEESGDGGFIEPESAKPDARLVARHEV